MKVLQTWHTRAGDLVLRTTATVEGTDYCAEHRITELEQLRGSVPPIKYIEHDQRKRLMAHIEKVLFA